MRSPAHPNQTAAQVMDEAAAKDRRPGFKLYVAEYKGKPSPEPIEFQCETSRDVQAWVAAIAGVVTGLRERATMSVNYPAM